MAQNYAQSNKNDYQIVKYVDNLEERVLGEKNILPKIRCARDKLEKLKGNRNTYWEHIAKENEQRFPQVEKNYKRGFVRYYITHSPIEPIEKVLNIFKKEHREVQA